MPHSPIAQSTLCGSNRSVTSSWRRRERSVVHARGAVEFCSACLYIEASRGQGMIIREWRGRTEPARADAYVLHFRNVVMPELDRVPGFLGAYLTRHTIGEILEYVVITRW